VKNLKTKNNDVVVLQLMSGSEIDFTYQRSVTFEDLETGTKVKVDVDRAKET
jgi:hypothetical protein